MKRFLLTACMLSVICFGAAAATTDEIIELSKKGAPEEQVLKQIEATPTEFDMGVSQVIALREAHASDKVIAAMLRHVGAGKLAVAGNPPVPFQPQAPVQVAPRVVHLPAPNPNASGHLTLDNLDDRSYAYFYEPAVQTLWFAAPNGQAGTVQAHTSQTISMKAGTYQVRYSGQPDAGVTVTVYEGDTSAINISRVVSNNVETLQATAFERGERKGSGQLSSNAAMLAPPQTVIERRVVEVPIYTQAPVYYYGAPGYYYGPNYYYGSSYYGSSYYGSGYYGHGYYGGGLNLNFSGSFGGHHHH